MTAFGRKKSAGDPPADENTGVDVEDSAESKDEAAAEEAEPISELDAARAALADAEERALRSQADYQNLRRRTQSDIDAAVTRAKSDVLAEAVTVLDYLDMALAAPVESEDAKNLKIGIEMTRGQLQALFDRLSVKPIEASGTFDPSIHQAVSTVESEEHEPGTIVEVVRGGWMIGEGVLRFAQVRVAAAPEDDEDVDDEASNETDDADAEGTEASAPDAPDSDA